MNFKRQKMQSDADSTMASQLESNASKPQTSNFSTFDDGTAHSSGTFNQGMNFKYSQNYYSSV